MRNILSSVVKTLVDNVVVVAVETIGDWITLSSAKITLAFWFVLTNLCEVPIPTLTISKVFGISLRASSALLANLTLFASTFTIYTFLGSLSVIPIPAKLVDAIPIACVVPSPA